MNIYVIYEEAVYRHNFLGAYATLEEAKNAGREAISSEAHDGHHDVVIGELTVGQSCEDAKHVGYFQKQKRYGNTSYVHRPIEENF
jgi:hypothetical protein